MIKRLCRVVMRLQEETGMPVTVDVDPDRSALVLQIDCGEKNAYAERAHEIGERWWWAEAAHLPGVVVECPLYCERSAYLGDPSERYS